MMQSKRDGKYGRVRVFSNDQNLIQDEKSLEYF